MTPNQISALEATVGRSLTQAEQTAIDGHITSLGRDDAAIAAILSVGRSKVGTVSTAVFSSWAAQTGMRAVIEDRAVASGDPLRSSALSLRDVVTGGASGIRLDYAANQAMLAAWVALGALSSANRDSLIALATYPDPITTEAVVAALNAVEAA